METVTIYYTCLGFFWIAGLGFHSEKLNIRMRHTNTKRERYASFNANIENNENIKQGLTRITKRKKL